MTQEEYEKLQRDVEDARHRLQRLETFLQIERALRLREYQEYFDRLKREARRFPCTPTT